MLLFNSLPQNQKTKFSTLRSSRICHNPILFRPYKNVSLDENNQHHNYGHGILA